MSSDTITTILGFIAGVCVLLGGQLPAEYKPYVDTVSGISVAVLGYFTNKKETEKLLG
jgi:hypothetical protein